MLERMRTLVRDEEGATMVEYALMVALIAVVALATVTALGGSVKTKFGEVNTAMGGATPQ